MNFTFLSGSQAAASRAASERVAEAAKVAASGTLAAAKVLDERATGLGENLKFGLGEDVSSLG